VFSASFGPDDYVGRVQADGKLYLHKPIAADQYAGKVADMPSYAYGGVALLLLVLPEIEKPADVEETK
jgi:hypothetical protein